MINDGMEFATEDEAREYFDDLSFCGNLTDSGYQVTKIPYESKRPYERLDKNYYVDEPKVWVVCAYVSGSYLYATNGSPSYNIALAKRMSKVEADKKAYFMNTKGTYYWESQRCI